MKSYLLFSLFCFSLINSYAQSEKNETSRQKINIEINDDRVLIDGKPFNENKEENLSLKKRKMTIISDGNKIIKFDGDDGPSNEKSTPFLGVTSKNSDDDKFQGAAVTDVAEESAAEKAGIQKGDIITQINEKKITGSESLSKSVKGFNPFDSVTVAIIRNGEVKFLKTTLGLRKEKTIRTFRMTDSQDNFILDDEPLLRNMDLESLKDLVSQESKAPKIGLKIQDSEEGDHVVVLKVTVGSPAAKAGLFKGDRITEIDGESVKNTEEVIEKLKEKENKSIYSIKFIRNKKEMNASLRMPKKLKIADL